MFESKLIKLIFISTIVLYQKGQCKGLKVKQDLYSSITDMNAVLQVEKLFIENLNEFVTKSLKTVGKLKIFLSDQYNIKTLNFIRKSKALINLQLYSKQLPEYFQNFKTNAKIIRQTNYLSVPDFSDLQGIVKGILLIQNVYNITAEQFVEGTITETIKFQSKLSASDCFYFGLVLNDLKFYNFAIEWFMTALRYFNVKKTNLIFNEITEATIINALNFSHYSDENIMEEKIRQIDLIDNDVMDDDGSDLILSPTLLNLHCSGAIQKEPNELKNLYCKYETENHPFLKLAPIKVEIQNFDPYLVVFYDVLSDNEIEILKNLTINKLVRARAWNPNIEEFADVSFRTAKFSHVLTDSHPSIPIINQRISDMTGLSMETIEPFQIASYGVGGYYDLHADYFDHYNLDLMSTSDVYYELGDRISTILFYLSNVEYGGATIFPDINSIIFPKKGSAAFWMNLFASGHPNEKTLHGSCPVVVGSKLIGTQWIRMGSQQYRRPCLLYPDHDVEDV